MGTEIDTTIARALLPARSSDGHKGSFGHLLIAAGSVGYTGAAKLTARSAERSGVGLVSLFVPEPAWPVVAGALSDTMSRGLPASAHGSFPETAANDVLRELDSRTALAIGPGIGQHDETTAFVAACLSGYRGPAVVDADALNALANLGGSAPNLHPHVIVTPHPGEAARLLDATTRTIQQNRAAAVRKLAERHNAIAVLKGANTLVAAPDGRIALNTTGNDGMAKGGSGDVLTGLLGGILAQGVDAFDAARLAVWVHGYAGDCARRDLGPRGMTASDVIDYIPHAWRELEQET